MTKKNDVDVVILGSGIGGSMLGAILAKHKLSVLLLDAGTHPRFAVGEATTPDTSFRFKLLAHKYDLPEIMHFTSFHRLRDNVSPASGVKRAFSFVYQREGKEQNPQETHQYPTLAPPMGPDCHFFRQDTDAYMLSIALTYGAAVRQQTCVSEIEFEKDKVLLNTDKGESFTTKYLVDAAGFRSPLADKLDLREDSSILRTNSRTIFNHMVGVKLYEQIGQPRKKYGLKYPLSQSTLHHIFDGGWFWIIPFNNHLDAVNPLCSVELVLNREIHPETGMDAEEEFFKYVNMFPEMTRQFHGSQAVRTWVTTGRMQYCSKRITGHRYCLLAHAAGFIDPLFSSGLNLTAATVDLMAKQLLKAFQSNDFSEENFKHIDDFFQSNLKIYDEVVGAAFVSFRDYDLWDAWFRVWVVALLVGTALNANLYLKYLETKDKSFLDKSEEEPYNGLLGSKFSDLRELYDQALSQMDRVRDGHTEPKEAAQNIRSLFKSMSYCPTFWRWHDPKVRTTPAFTFWGMTRMYIWYLLHAPRHVRNHMFDWNPIKAYAFIFRSIRRNSIMSTRRKRFYIRDVFKAWNKDWHTKWTLENK